MTATMHTPSVRIVRTISASPHDVYRAWLDPEMIRRWLAPGAMDVTRVEVDERVGGHYRIWQAQSGIEGGGFDGQLLELVPDQRIVFRLGFVGPDRLLGPKYDSILTISLRGAAEGGTVLTLVHEKLEQLAQALPQVARNVEAGWNSVIDKLAARLVAEQRT